MSELNISKQNEKFWNELCGSQLAKSLGIAESSKGLLKKFDNWYFDFYPYLFDHIPFKCTPKKEFLKMRWTSVAGLDIYAAETNDRP
jgi:hypothetical protein